MGSVHDTKDIAEFGFLTVLDSQRHIGDKGYIGLGIITPVRKPAHSELADIDKRNSATVNCIRYLIERVIANLKTCRVHLSWLPPPFQHL